MKHPQVIGPYRLTGLLGQGGMGAVYRGLAPDGQAVAIKLSLGAEPELGAEGGVALQAWDPDDPTRAERLRLPRLAGAQRFASSTIAAQGWVVGKQGAQAFELGPELRLGAWTPWTPAPAHAVPQPAGRLTLLYPPAVRGALGDSTDPVRRFVEAERAWGVGALGIAVSAGRDLRLLVGDAERRVLGEQGVETPTSAVAAPDGGSLYVWTQRGAVYQVPLR